MGASSLVFSVSILSFPSSLVLVLVFISLPLPPFFSAVALTNCQVRPTFSLGNKSGTNVMFLVQGEMAFFVAWHVSSLASLSRFFF